MVIWAHFRSHFGGSFELVLGAPRQQRIVLIFSLILGTIFGVILGGPGLMILMPFSELFGSSFGKHFQGVLERPGGSFSLTMSMKMKVRLLFPWPSSEVVFGVKMGLQLESKMLPKLV